MEQNTALQTLWSNYQPRILPDDFYGAAWLALDLSIANKELPATGISEVLSLGPVINSWIEAAGSKVGYGGHNESRAWYQTSNHFSSSQGNRSIHFGVDLWVPAGTPILATFDGQIHSFKDNANFLDYGPTIILQHEANGLSWYSLHGHLSQSSLKNLTVGQTVRAGQQIATVGLPEENGRWIPHLHFQLISDMQGWVGDFPGVSTPADRDKFVANCPDPGWLLHPELISR